MRSLLLRLICLLTVAISVPFAFGQAGKTLDIYFVDVEGGQATLFVTPDKQSLLVDTGWDGFGSRDAKRIAAVVKTAGLTHIDTVMITHYHTDHVGGIPQLAALVPISSFVDHGALFEHCPACVSGFDAYMSQLAHGRSTRRSVVAGDSLPFGEVQVHVVSSNGKTISKPLASSVSSNEFCASSEIRPPDQTENAKSVGIVIDFGRFRTSDLGDLTWDMERKVMCPRNLIGDVSLLIVSHHGWMQSSSPAYVAAVHATAAIMDNGATKGGSLPTLETLDAIHGMDLWQLHRSEEGGKANTAEERIANLVGDPARDQGFYFKVSAHRDGSFTVFNQRTGVTKSYPSK